MPHTKSRYMQDLGFSDGRMRAAPQQELIAFGTTVLTRTAAGNINFAQAASQTVQYTVNVTTMLLRRFGFFEDLQEQFGGAGIAGAAEYQGRPDTIPAMSAGQELTPRSAFKLKGLKVLSFDVIYAVGTNPLTAHTCQVNQTTYVQGQAQPPTIVNVLASAANGLGTAVNGAQIQVVNVPLATPAYLIAADADLWFEINAQTPVGGTYVIWGVDVLFEYNFN